jgi:RNAse (barnase) inhibitor barstar
MSAMELNALLADPERAGAYFVDTRDREALLEAGRALHFRVQAIDLRACTDTDAVLREIAETLEFPDWFGGNLDALADCLNDLSWLAAPGYLLVLEHIGAWREQAAEDVEAVVEILQDAAARWGADDVPFWAMLPLPSHEVAAVENAGDD